MGSGPHFGTATGLACDCLPVTEVTGLSADRRVATESEGTPGTSAVVYASRSARSPACHCHRAADACHASTATILGCCCRTWPESSWKGSNWLGRCCASGLEIGRAHV